MSNPGAPNPTTAAQPPTLNEQMTVEHFKHICGQTNYFNDKLIDAFTFHVQTLSAIVGGSIWLALQDSAQKRIGSAEFLSNGLVVLLSVVTTVRVFGNYTAWWGARKTQRKMLITVGAPHWFLSSWMEVLLIASVVASCWFFIRENPFSVLRAT